MKSKIFKKARITSAVMLATATMVAGTAANAGSLLAPLVLNDSQHETFLTLKTGANGIAGNFTTLNAANEIHYYWFKKNWGTTPVFGLPNRAIMAQESLNSGAFRKRGCQVSNTFGKMTPKDLVFQSTAEHGGVGTPVDQYPYDDQSTVSGYDVDPAPGSPNDDFAGMLVVNRTADLGTQEGDFSGFSYVVNYAAGFMLDHKLLNNHHSTKSGDFSRGFISKKSIDYSWWPDVNAQTFWYTAVTGNNMAEGGEDAPNSIYDASVMIGSDIRQIGTAGNFDPTQGSPQDYTNNSKGVFDNDENFYSGARDLEITCLGAYQRQDFIQGGQFNQTADGGHTRRSISTWDSGNVPATGAITFKFELFNAGGWDNSGAPGSTQPANPASGAGFLPVSWMIETSGNLSVNGTKANKPY